MNPVQWFREQDGGVKVLAAVGLVVAAVLALVVLLVVVLVLAAVIGSFVLSVGGETEEFEPVTPTQHGETPDASASIEPLPDDGPEPPLPSDDGVWVPQDPAVG